MFRRLVLAMFFCAALFQAAYADRRVALVIGNSNYINAAALSNPSNDATDMANVLRQIGFETIVAIDVNKTVLDQKLREFSGALNGAAIGLFFYAGHGMQVAGRNYVIPVDAKLTTAADLVVETIDVDQILSIMQTDENRVSIAFLDACRDNPLARTYARNLPATRALFIGSGFTPVNSARNTLIGFSTAPNAIAIDGSGRNSPFSAALVKHIKTPGLDISLVMRRVTADVEMITGGMQSPWHSVSLTKDVILSGSTGTAVASLTLSTPAPVPTTSLQQPIVQASSLPLNISVKPELVRLVQANPFFSGAPPIRVRTYNLDTVTNWTANGISGTTTLAAEITVRALGNGLLTSKSIQRGLLTQPQSNTHSSYTYERIEAANGLITLGYRSKTTTTLFNGSPFSSTTTETLSALRNMQGRIFPMRVGNRFSYDEIVTMNTPPLKDEYTRSNECEVVTTYDAKRFNSSLSGIAYFVACDIELKFKKTKTADQSSRWRALFFEDLGTWIAADPVSPKERIVQSGEFPSTSTLRTVVLAN